MTFFWWQLWVFTLYKGPGHLHYRIERTTRGGCIHGSRCLHFLAFTFWVKLFTIPLYTWQTSCWWLISGYFFLIVAVICVCLSVAIWDMDRPLLCSFWIDISNPLSSHDYRVSNLTYLNQLKVKYQSWFLLKVSVCSILGSMPRAITPTIPKRHRGVSLNCSRREYWCVIQVWFITGMR